MKKNTIRNLVLGTTVLLGAGYIIKRLTRRNAWEEAVMMGKVIPNKEEPENLDIEERVYYPLGMLVEKNGKTKVKEFTKEAV